MRPKQLVIAAADTDSRVWLPDTVRNPFNIGFGAIVTGTANYSVQHTFDNPYNGVNLNTTATWYDHPDVAAQTTNQDGTYAFPVRGIRLHRNSGTGQVILNLVQAGHKGG